MRARRIWAMFVARNKEFYRDRAAFGWNVVFPFLLIAGFALIFDNNSRNDFKVGVFPCPSESVTDSGPCLPEALSRIQYVDFIPLSDEDAGLEKLIHHKIDMLIRIDKQPFPFWTNETSPKGYMVERIFKGVLTEEQQIPQVIARQPEVGMRQIRYLDWFFPGVVGMSMMFSAMYGVGYIIVRYRKNGVLKRLEATPLTAFEYLAALTLSRLLMIAFSVLILWIGADLVFDLTMEGSYFDLAVMMAMGSLSMIALGLVVASRSTSEEFAEGLINVLNWPMMFLSGVWFSIEGAPRWLQAFAQIFPLTHLLKGMRSIINDGASLVGVRLELAVLTAMTLIFLLLGAVLFKWNR